MATVVVVTSSSSSCNVGGKENKINNGSNVNSSLCCTCVSNEAGYWLQPRFYSNGDRPNSNSRWLHRTYHEETVGGYSASLKWQQLSQ